MAQAKLLAQLWLFNKCPFLSSVFFFPFPSLNFKIDVLKRAQQIVKQAGLQGQSEPLFGDLQDLQTVALLK